MKKNFEKAEVELICLNEADVIVTSVLNAGGGSGDDNGNGANF